MHKNLEYFLIVAEELNISKAAKRLYISQQGLSSHIKRLESSYGVKFFNRKPKLALTEAGQTMVSALNKIKVLERGLEAELGNIESGTSGQLNIGIHPSRSEFIGTMVFPKYWNQYPNVSIRIIDGVTRSFEMSLINGELDMFIGVNPRTDPAFEIIPLMNESIFVTVSDSLLRNHFPAEYPKCKERFGTGIDLREFTNVPFFINNENSTVTKIISNYLYQKGIELRFLIKTNSNELRMRLSLQNYGACFISQMHLLNLLNNKMGIREIRGEDSKINIFPIVDLKQYNEISLVCHKEVYHPKYLCDFMGILVEQFKKVSK